jgi:REP element-mobilizing transposase RayT
MPKLNHSGTDLLRRGRASAPNARYFITLCTHKRHSGLHASELRQALIDALRKQHVNNDINLHYGTIMPDHLHLLFTLGHRLTLSQVLGKYKSWTSNDLWKHCLQWQDNFYDHRLRQDKALEAFARYIFLNPYRKKLLQPTEVWPGWICNKHYRPEFYEHLIDGKFPPVQWLTGPTGDLEELIGSDWLDEAEEK